MNSYFEESFSISSHTTNIEFKQKGFIKRLKVSDFQYKTASASNKYILVRLSGVNSNTTINNNHGNYLAKLSLGNTSLTEIIFADNDNNIFIVGSVNDYGVPDADAFPRYFAGGCPACFYDDVYSPTGEFESEGFLIKLDQDGNRLWATYFGGTETTNITDITQFGDYVTITGISTLNMLDFPLVEVPDVYFDDVNENATSYISMFNKSTELVWSTFLGDNAGNAGIALTTDNSHPELYMVGNIGFSDVLYDFKPLCDPGGAAFYQNGPLSIETEVNELYKNNDGYILGFDISMFELRE